MKIKTLIAICVMALAFMSCKKDPVKGCKTSYATNYNSSAEEDDGSCTYESKVIFWQDQTNASSWSGLGVTALTFYVDGQIIGSCAASVYNTSAPTCSGNGLASVTKSLGNSSSKSFSFSIKDQTGVSRYSGSLTIDGSTCLIQRLN